VLLFAFVAPPFRNISKMSEIYRELYSCKKKKIDDLLGRRTALRQRVQPTREETIELEDIPQAYFLHRKKTENSGKCR
jgi:glutathionyl-hydroquinone reductase